jgi:diguanylate cyclase (GGDEF)-like protein
MAHTLPDAYAAPHGRSWGLTVGALALGLGTGIIATGGTLPGAGIAALGCALLGGTWMFRKKSESVAERAGAAATAGRPAAIDPETGLPCPPQLTELLRREMARSQRYGDRTALAVFDIDIASFTPDASHPVPPSPARHVAATLVECAREADVVARIDATHFVVILTESDEVGAAQFAERTRTRLGTQAFARAADGHGIYIRAWAGWARWDARFETPADYLAAAMENLE